MASVRKRGETFLITAYMGYQLRDKKDGTGKKYAQLKKTTTYCPPENVTAAKAEKLAKEYATLWENKIRGYTALDENRTFSELCDWYWEVVAPTVLKSQTMAHNKHAIEVYAMDKLGSVKLKNLTPQLLDNFLHDLGQNGRVKDWYKLKDIDFFHAISQNKSARENKLNGGILWQLSNGKATTKESGERIAAALGMKFHDIFEYYAEDRSLSPSTVQHVRKILSAICSAAVRKEIITRNPVAKTTPIHIAKEATSFLDEQQAATLIKALDDCNLQFKTMITMLIMTGMRVGELTGLTWDNVDLEKGVIYIRLNLAYHPIEGKQTYVLDTPKTKASERYVVIPQSLVDLLKAHKAEQDKRKAAFGKDWITPDMVFVGDKGGFFSGRVVNVQFKKFAARIGLPDGIHIHSLRHTTASLLINSDVPAKVISEQLGHASTTITQDLYSHVFQSSKVKAMQALDLKLGGLIQAETGSA
jgi:integrase